MTSSIARIAAAICLSALIGVNARATSGLDEWHEAIAVQNPRFMVESLKTTVAKMSADDLQAALKETLSGPVDDLKAQQVGTLLSGLAAKNPAAAMASYSQLPNTKYKSYYYLREIMSGWIRSDPNSAMEFILKQDPASRSWMLYDLFKEVAQTDYAKAETLAEKVPPENLERVHLTMFTVLSDQHPAQAAEALAHVPPGERSSLLPVLAGSWAGRDGEAAAAWAMTLTDPQEKKSAISNVLVNWEHYAPDKAKAFKEKLPQDIKEWLDEVAEAWKTGKPTVIPNKGASGEQSEQWKLLDVRNQALAKARENIPDALAWADRQTGPAHASAIQIVVSYWATKEPDKALDYILKNTTPNDGQNLIGAERYSIRFNQAHAIELLSAAGDTASAAQLAGLIAESWAGNDPAAAAAWAGTLPAQQGDAATRAAVGQWCRQDLQGAGKYTDSLPKDLPTRIAAVEGMAYNLAASDPSTGLQWAMLLTSEKRMAALTRCLSSLAQRDPKAAQAWLNTAKISESEKQALGAIVEAEGDR